MVIRERERRIAVSAWRVAAGMIEARDPEVSELARAALARPCAETIRPLLDAGYGRPWMQSLIETLAQVGIAAAEDVLAEPDRWQQLEDAGGRIVLDVGDLTESELEALADSEIPPELRWNSTDLEDDKEEGGDD